MDQETERPIPKTRINVTNQDALFKADVSKIASGEIEVFDDRPPLNAVARRFNSRADVKRD
jgi:hypothetical protein